MIFNVPNIISYFRIVSSPVFLYFFISDDNLLIILSFPIYILSALSDWFDGWYARKYNQMSKWGVFIDPLADKILNSTAFIAFVFQDIIPFWMVLIIIIRDLFMTFLRLFADSHKMPVKTSYLAKVKTVLQFALIIYILLIFFISHLNNNPKLLETVYQSHIYYLMLFLTLFTVWTMVDYLLKNRPIVRKLFGAK